MLNFWLKSAFIKKSSTSLDLKNMPAIDNVISTMWKISVQRAMEIMEHVIKNAVTFSPFYYSLILFKIC